MGSENYIRKKIIKPTHQDIIAEAKWKFPGYTLYTQLVKYRELLKVLYNYSKDNREIINHKIVICNLFIESIYSFDLERGRN